MSTTLILSEALLSLYPVLVKSTRADVLIQTLFRLGTASLVALPMVLSVVQWSDVFQWVSLLYVAHIFASYKAFQLLEVGTALTVFYLYPLFNVLIKSAWTLQGLSMDVVGYMALSLVGVYLITHSQSSVEKEPVPVEEKRGPTGPAGPTGPTGPAGPSLTGGQGAMTQGLLWVVFAALSESLIYIFFKLGSEKIVWKMLFQLCFTGSVVLAIVVALAQLRKDTGSRSKTPTESAPTGGAPTESAPTQVAPTERAPTEGALSLKESGQLILWNVLLGVVGYLLRFTSVHQVSTELYSILSFTGVVFGYLYGWLFYAEKITWSKLVGTACILVSALNVGNLS
jgi:drug/metabolite transporter (DMT)-like permease